MRFHPEIKYLFLIISIVFFGIFGYSNGQNKFVVLPHDKILGIDLFIFIIIFLIGVMIVFGSVFGIINRFRNKAKLSAIDLILRMAPFLSVSIGLILGHYIKNINSELNQTAIIFSVFFACFAFLPFIDNLIRKNKIWSKNYLNSLITRYCSVQAWGSTSYLPSSLTENLYFSMAQTFGRVTPAALLFWKGPRVKSRLDPF